VTYILDTNIISAFLKGDQKVFDKLNAIVLNGEEILINGISYYEIKRGLIVKEAKKQLSRFEQMCKICGLMLMDNKDIFDKAAELYAGLKREGKLLNDADVLIASMVRCRNAILVTNDADFNRIQGLKTENWLT